MGDEITSQRKAGQYPRSCMRRQQPFSLRCRFHGAIDVHQHGRVLTPPLQGAGTGPNTSTLTSRCRWEGYNFTPDKLICPNNFPFGYEYASVIFQLFSPARATGYPAGAAVRCIAVDRPPLAIICTLHRLKTLPRGGAPYSPNQLEQPLSTTSILIECKAIFGAAIIDREQGGVLNPLLFLPRKFFPADWFSCDILFQ